MIQEEIYTALSPLFDGLVYPIVIPEKINGLDFIVRQPVAVFSITSMQRDIVTHTICGPGLVFTRFSVRFYGPNYMLLWGLVDPSVTALDGLFNVEMEEIGLDLGFDNEQLLFGVEILGRRFA